MGGCLSRPRAGVASEEDPGDEPFDSIVQLLATGPVILGESHDRPEVKDLIRRLLQAGRVRVLSLEGPVAPEFMMQANQGGIQANQKPTYNNHADLATGYGPLALDATVPVFFHDMPYQFCRLRTVPNPQPGALGYVDYARTFAGSDAIPRNADRLTNMLPQRNRFLGRYLTAQGVQHNLRGLVVLCGSHHVIASECGGRANTIQGVLGLSDDRVFVWDETHREVLPL